MSTHRSILRTLAIAVSLLCASVFVFGYLTHELLAARERITQLQQDALKREERSAAERALNERVVETEDERKELATFFVQFSDPAPLLEDIEELATRTNVSIEILSVTDELRSPTVPEAAGKGAPVGAEKKERVMRVTLELTGAWNACYRFLFLLEHMPYALRAEQVTLARGEDGLWQGTLVFYVLGV